MTSFWMAGFGRHALAITLIMVALGVSVPSTHAHSLELPDFASPIPLGGTDHEPTAAWKEFCSRLPAECSIDLAEPPVIPVTAAVWELITAVNAGVNEAMDQITDRAHWDVEDRWDYPDDGQGDCEDIQLLKRKLLSDAGLPRRAMRMTVVLDYQGAGHAVLTILTDRGDFILDNNIPTVRPWHETGYEFIKREGSDSTAWVALGGAPERMVVASR